MAVTKLWISFYAVYVIDDLRFWGPDEWYLTAKVDGKPVGDPKQKFDAVARHLIMLRPAGEQYPTSAAASDTKTWSTTVDVSKKKSTDTVEIRFSASDLDHDLGQVSAILKYPFDQERDLLLWGSVVKGRRYYVLNLEVHIAEEVVNRSTNLGQVFVNRQATHTKTYTTLKDTRIAPRVEICPVVPIPTTGMPKRPVFPRFFAAGKGTKQANAVKLVPPLNLNALPNPAVIPILSPGNPNIEMAKMAARVAVTYVQPGDLDTRYFCWHIKSGPAAFFGKTYGKEEVLVYGTGTGASDKEAIIELRWKDAKGPLLSTFRAWVGKIRYIPYRALIVDPSNDALRINSRPEHVRNHIDMANVLLWHAGLHLIPDTDQTPWDGAIPWDGLTDKEHADKKLHAKPALPLPQEEVPHVPFPPKTGIFEIKLPKSDDAWTIGVNDELTPVATRLNFRPGVMHFCYIKSSKDSLLCGAATDLPQLSGKPETLGGSPSTSWVYPSGVPPDDDAKPVVMQTFPKFTRDEEGDKAYLQARGLPANAMDRLFGLIMPDYTYVTNPDWGQTIAHETGHVLGLMHRGNPGFDPKRTNFWGLPDPKIGSDDGVNDRTGRGYPWKENTMCYGAVRSQDLDIIQAAVIRRHPVLK